jgi:hypothetical protein
MKRPRILRAGVRRPSSSRRRIALSVVLIGFLGGGIAYSYWTTQGTGSGNATAGTLQTVKIDTVSFPTATAVRLYPGGPTTPVTITVTNPNSFPVTVSSLTYGAITSENLGCSGSNAEVTIDLTGIENSTISANATQNLTASASMGVDSASACQGATFSSSFNLGVRK